MTCSSAAGRGQVEDTRLVHSLVRQRIRHLGVNISLRGRRLFPPELTTSFSPATPEPCVHRTGVSHAMLPNGPG